MPSGRSKYILIGLLIALPSLVLGALTLFPQYDLSEPAPLFHFYIVTFVTASAVVISIFLTSGLGPNVQPRHLLAALAFLTIGSIFFSHGLATQNALIDYSHPAVQWSAWLTLFGGAVLFTLASLDSPSGTPRWLKMRLLVYLTVAGILLYSGIALFFPQLLTAIDQQASPIHALVVFGLTLILWLVASIRLLRIWLVTRTRVDGVLTIVSFLLLQATVSLHRFPVWHLSWWLYHALLLIGFLITVYVLASEYEQARRFRLLRYYLAAGLILTVLFGLLASALSADYSTRTLTAQIEASSEALANQVAGELTDEMSTAGLPADARALANYLSTRTTFDPPQPVGKFQALIVYDLGGRVLYASDSKLVGQQLTQLDDFNQAVQGNASAEVYSPGDSFADYAPARQVSLVATYVPVLPTAHSVTAPFAILTTVQEIPELDQAIIQARATALVISTLTMVLLFLGLLAIVRRADRVIILRTSEVTTALDNLRRVEGMRDNLTKMIVHDLRNPLHSLRASMDLLAEDIQPSEPDDRLELIEGARRAGRSMTTLIDNLLNVSKLESHELRLQIRNVRVREMLNERVRGFEPIAATEQKNLSLNCPTDLTAELDPNLIGRVVENLLDNAFKYTRHNGTIQVVASGEDSRVKISVRDDGPGVPDEYKDRIFEKFFQLEINDEATRKGVGLGLAFCRLAVQAHGGDIQVQDTPGGGSNFTFWLPKSQNGVMN